MSKNDGGPAFPVQTVTGLPNADVLWGYNGMTLRDYFAAAAMQAVAPQLAVDVGMEGLAKLCYDVADVMITERSRP